MNPAAESSVADRRQRRKRGFALLIVLWIFIVLFVLGAEFSGEMRQDAQATANFAGETQSYYLATAAANRTFYRALIARDDASLDAPTEELGEVKEPLVHVDGKWHQEEMWGAPVWVRVTDEAGKIPINLAEENVLRLILGNMGLNPDQASGVADSIMDWRDKDDEHRINGAESEYYSKLPRPYIAKNAPLDSLEELLLIKGVTQELYFGGTEDIPIGMKDIFSVFNRRATLNLRSASPEVLRVMFHLDDEQLKQVLETRETQTGSLFAVLEAMLPDPTLAQVLSDEAPNMLFVEAQAKIPESRVAAHIGAVIDLGESNEGIYILRWMDQLPVAEVS